MPFKVISNSFAQDRFNLVIPRPAVVLVPVVYAMCGIAFLFDLTRDNTLAFGIFYAPLVATSVVNGSWGKLWWLTALALAMVVVGAFFPVVNSDLPDLIGNRLLSVIAVLATTACAYHARRIQERLAEETRRAEAAERIKTDVLTNLSQEIRTPLHSLIGVLTLTAAVSKPDQRLVLDRIQSDGKRLLSTIDNLIDLTQIEEHTLRPQAVDITTIARSAADYSRQAAQDRQVAIAITAEDDALALADSWAVRRILDNLLANAVRVSPPGATVTVSVTRNVGMIIASISDHGRGFTNPTREQDRFTASHGAGLALSERLALAMNGRLAARNQTDAGAIVSLSLPAA